MKKLLAAFFLIISVVFPMTASASPAELVDPRPISVPANVSNEALVKSIKRALIGRGWTIEQASTGKIDAVLYLRTHVARVAISYTDKEVGLVYVSSENLNYKEKKGKRYIHKNYLSWVNNVMIDINKNVQLDAME